MLEIPSPATKTAGAAAVEELVVGDVEPLPLVALPLPVTLVMMPVVGRPVILGVGKRPVESGVSP